MKHLLLFFGLLPLLLPAQRVTVSEAISIRSDLAYDLIGEMGGHFLFFRDRGGNFEVNAFDESMRIRWTKELELAQKRPQVLHVMGSKERFHVFYACVEERNSVLKVHTYDPAANLIDSATVHNFGFLLGGYPRLSFLVSDNRETVSILETKGNNEFRLLSFDLERMQLLWQRTVFIEGVYVSRDFVQAFNDNYGRAYLIFQQNGRFGSSQTSGVEIIQVEPGTDELGTDLRRIQVFLDDLQIYEVQFTYDNLNRKLVGCGLYSRDNYAWAEGAFFVSMNPDTDLHTEVFSSEFDEQFTQSFMAKAEGKRNRGIADAKIRHLVLRRDGGLLVFGERSRIYERFAGGVPMPTDRLGGRYTTDYFFDEMFVLSFHPDGSSHFRHVLYKKQFSQDDYGAFSSFFLMKTPTNLRLLYNDDIKFENTVSEYVLEGNGALNRNSVLSTQNQKIRLRFRDAVQVSANEVIVPSEFRNRLKLVRISYR